MKILTGDRPTGLLHLGHYVGTLQNRVKLQASAQTFLIIADLHMLTTKNAKEEIALAANFAREMVLDQLAAGIDPRVSTFYLQSAIPEIGELNTLFQNLVTVPRLMRIPSLKEMATSAKKEEMPYGLLGYPVLQAADILSVKATHVPVGKDNFAHLELTREIARRFNSQYADIFPVPETIESETTNLVGTDGKAKMSKSLGNAIFLSDTADAVKKKVNSMYTDPNRLRADTPGTVEGNVVFQYLDVFLEDKVQLDALKARYRAGTIADVELKTLLTTTLNGLLDPMRERRDRFSADKGYVDEIIYAGTLKTRETVKSVVSEARKAMGLASTWNSIRRSAEKRIKSGTSTKDGHDM